MTELLPDRVGEFFAALETAARPRLAGHTPDPEALLDLSADDLAILDALRSTAGVTTP